MTKNEKLTLLFNLADLQEQLTLELEPIVTNQLKFEVKAISKRCKKLIRFLDNVVGNKRAIDFGDDTDNLREIIEKYFVNNVK